jgi:hypothetical protein
VIIDDFADYLGNLVMVAVYALLYPFIQVIQALIDFIYIFVDAISNLVTAFFGLFYTVYGFVVSFFTGLIPNSWLVLMLLELSILFIFRMYKFLKDVSFHGYKL